MKLSPPGDDAYFERSPASLGLLVQQNKTRHSLKGDFRLYSLYDKRVTRTAQTLADLPGHQYVNLASLFMDAELQDRAQSIRERILQLGDSL